MTSADSESNRKRAQAFTRCSYLTHNSFGETSVAMTFPVRKYVASFALAIIDVVLNCPNEQVARTNARAIVAAMKDEHGRCSEMHLPGQAMNAKHFGPHAKHAVSMCLAASPCPTLTEVRHVPRHRTIHADLRPESTDSTFVHAGGC